MTEADHVRFTLDFGSGVLDITNYVKAASGTRGREAVGESTDPGEANIFLHDPAREFDPLNGGARTIDGVTFLSGDLAAGVKVTHEIRATTSDPWVVRWDGEVREWLPSIWEGDGTDTNPAVELVCSGSVGELHRTLPPFGGDYIADRLAEGNATFFYPLNNTNGGAGGRVEDFSGRALDGVAYPDEIAVPGTPGYVSSTPGRMSFLTGSATHASSVVVPLPQDTLRTSPGGFLLACRVFYSGKSSPSGGFEIHTLCSEGVDVGGGVPDGFLLALFENRSGGATNDTNIMQMYLSFRDDGSGISQTARFNVGTRVEWVGKDRLFMAGYDGNDLWGICAVVNGDGTIDGVTHIVDSATFDLRGTDSKGPAPTGYTDARLFRLGLGYPLTGSTRGSFVGEMDLAAGGYVAASASWAVEAAEAIAANGFVERLGSDRARQFRDAVGFPAARWADNFAIARTYNEATSFGRTSALARLVEIADNEQGRLYQPNGGGVKLDDFAACKTAATSTGTEPTYTDQVDGDTGLGYITARITTTNAAILNTATVRTPSGYTFTHTNATSVTVNGVRSASFELILADEDDVQSFAQAITSRFGYNRTTITDVEILPKRRPSAWWPELVARDIGDRIILERQPGGVGTVASVPSVIEGETWSWDASADEYRTILKCSPATYYTGHSFP